MSDTPTTMLYMGRPLDSFTKEELIKIAEEGWRSYHSAIESNLRSMRLMAEFNQALSQGYR
jgi:hypothetical protein